MRRISLLCAATIATCLAPPSTGAAQAPGGSTVEKDAPWALMSVSRDGRTLFVRYASGGCDYGGHAKVTESSATITIRVTQFTRTGPGVACTAILEELLLSVRLSRPVAGRRLAGNFCPLKTTPGCPPPGPIEVVRGSDVLREVPRMTGLAVADARLALRRQQFRVRLRGRGPTVVGERPAPGTDLGTVDRTPVTIVRGRHRTR